MIVPGEAEAGAASAKEAASPAISVSNVRNLATNLPVPHTGCDETRFCPLLSRARLHEARLVREDDRLDAVSEPELPEDVSDVRLDGRFADEELLGDLCV